MGSRKTTNVLLLINTFLLTLVLIVTMGGSFTTPLMAWGGKMMASREPIPVAIHARKGLGKLWYPCHLSDGDRLMVEVAR